MPEWPQPGLNDNGMMFDTVIRVERPISGIYRPKPDITAYELARLIPFISGRLPMYERHWAELGPQVTRHIDRSE